MSSYLDLYDTQDQLNTTKHKQKNIGSKSYTYTFLISEFGFIYFQYITSSRHKWEYAQINQRFVFFIYDIVHTRKVLGMDANYHMASIVVLIISIFSGIIRALVISDIVLTYRRVGKNIKYTRFKFCN